MRWWDDSPIYDETFKSLRLEDVPLNDLSLMNEGLNFSTLSTVEIWSSSLTLIGLEELCKDLSKYNSLTHLSICYNHFGDPACQIIAFFFSDTNSLRSLSLIGDQIGNFGLETLISSLPDLCHLDLSSNLLTDMAMCPKFPVSSKLASLNISCNYVHLRLDGYLSISSHLTCIRIDFNKIGEEGLHSLLRECGKGKIKSLGLSLCGVVSHHFNTHLQDLLQLRELDLSFNMLDDNCLKAIEDLLLNSTLKRLFLQGNMFSLIGLRQILSHVHMNGFLLDALISLQKSFVSDVQTICNRNRKIRNLIEENCAILCLIGRPNRFTSPRDIQVLIAKQLLKTQHDVASWWEI